MSKDTTSTPVKKPSGKDGGSSRPNRVRMGSNVAISIIAAAAILIMINYLAMRHFERADWTASGMYTLSEKTAKVVGSLDQEVKVFVLWSQQDPRFTDVKEVLDGYRALSEKLEIEVVDPDMNPEQVEMIIQRYGAKMTTDTQGNMGIEAGVIVVSGENVKFVSHDDFEDFSNQMMMQDPASAEDLSEFRAEQELTAAIMRVISDEQATVCFTQGHGEWQMDGFGGRGLGMIRDELKQDSYRVQVVATAGADAVPEMCAMVVVAGPQRAFLKDEAALVEAYLNDGGRLLLLLDPLIEGDRFMPTGLEQLTARAGIELIDDIVLEVDPRRLVSETPFTFLVSEFTTHASVKPLGLPEGTDPSIRAYPVALSTVRTLRHVEGSGTVADVLARSSQASWGEVDVASLGSGETVPEKDGRDTPGPAVLAMASVIGAVDPAVEGRLVVVGDSDFLSEELLVNSGLFNRDMWTSLVGWLTAREDLISIAPKNPEHVRLNLTDDDVALIWQVVIGEVLLILIVGVVMWFRRRR